MDQDDRQLCLNQAGTYIKEFVHGDLGRTHPRYVIPPDLYYHLYLRFLAWVHLTRLFRLVFLSIIVCSLGTKNI